MGKHLCHVTVESFVQILRKGTDIPGRSIFGFFFFLRNLYTDFHSGRTRLHSHHLAHPLSHPFLYRDDQMCSCVCVFPVWAPQVPDMVWLSPVSEDSAKSIVGTSNKYLGVLVDSFTFLCPLCLSKTKVLDRLTQWLPDRPCLLNVNTYLISKSLTCPVGHSSL